MNAPRWLAAIVLVVLACPASAQNPALMMPGKEHQEMAREVGVWDGEMSLWESPDAQPVASKGVETITKLGEFWIVGEFVGDLMGMEFKGRSQTTYDPLKKQYFGTWIDSMSPVMMTLTGAYDEASHTLTMMMEGIDAMTGQPGKWKSITHYIDEDTKTFEMHAPVEGQEGQWWKMMEIKYKRRK
jgi:hypothetical protein